MLTVSDISRALADCGDGVEVKADGHTLLTAQIEGTGEGRFLNLVSQPEGVRLPAEPTLPGAGVDQAQTIANDAPPPQIPEPAPATEEPIVVRTDEPADAPAVDPNTTDPLL